MRALLKPGGLALVLAALATTAAGAAPPEPQRTTATYADWTLRCETTGDEETRACELAQSVTMEGQQRPVAQIAVGPKPDGSFTFVAQLPLNVWLPAGVTLSAGDKAIVSAEFKRCFPQFCLAEAVMTAAGLKSMRGGTGSGELAFQDGAQRDVKVPFSFDGFPDAYTALTADKAKK